MTFELSLPKVEKKHRGMALKSSVHEQKEQVYSDSNNDIDDTIVMLAKNYSRVMKRLNQMNGKNVPQDVKDNFQQRFQKNTNPHRNSKSGERSGKDKGIQCHECEGFGHIQKECPNFLKKQTKGYNATLSDEEDEDSNSDQISNFVAFTASVHTHESTNEFGECFQKYVLDEELSNDAMNEAYNTLHTKWVEESQILDKQSALILTLTEDKARLLETIVDLKKEVGHLNGELEHMTETVRMLNSGTDSLDKILTSGKPAKNMKGLGYTHGASSSQTTFVPQKQTSQMSRNLPQPSGNNKSHDISRYHQFGPNRSPVNRPRWVCHYCGRKGHIRPFCYRLYGRNVRQHRSIHRNVSSHQQPATRLEWRVKIRPIMPILPTHL